MIRDQSEIFEGVVLDRQLNTLDNMERARIQASCIKLHTNPFFIDKKNSYKQKFYHAYGKDEIMKSIFEDMARHVKEQTHSEKSIWILAIRGSQGSGKSLFSRKLILQS